MLLLDVETNRFVECNQAAVAMLRMGSRDEMLNQRPADLSPPVQPDGVPTAEKAAALLAKVLELGSLRFEWLHRRADGEVFPVEVLLTTIEHRGRRMIHTVWRDVTERKRAEEELRASEEQYHSLADLIPGIVWTARSDGSIDYANQFWFKYTGLTMPQTEGSGWTVTVHPDDLEHLSQVWGKALQCGEPVEVEYRIRRAADGVYRWFLAQGRPVRDREGRIVKWFGLITDIEDQKQGQKVLERQNALVRLLHQITVAAYEAAPVEEALEAGIGQVCAYTGWPIGHVYVLADDGSEELVPTSIWHLDRPTDF